MGGLLRAYPGIGYVMTIATVYVPVWLFVRRMPAREKLAPRLALLGAVHAVIAAALVVGVDASAAVAGPIEAYGSAATIITLLAFYAALPAFVLLVYDCSPWDAIICAAAGYTTQNLASSTIELLHMLSHPASTAVSGTDEFASGIAVYALVYLICHRLFIDRASRAGLGHGSRRYVIPMVAVLLVVIYFDTRVKLAVGVAGPGPLALSLRVVHVATCAFMLYAEYQIVYVGHLAADVAAERELRAEEERMWQLSQRNVDAINARVHDMRHAVTRTLAASGADIDRETLAEVVREIRVYDASVRTGNAVLDTVLSEKGLVCERSGVQLAVIAEGATLGFLMPADLFSLIGGLIDQVAAVAVAYPDPERRCIALSVRTVAGMAALHLDCPAACDAVLDLEPVMMVVERCGGTLASSCDSGMLAVDVLLPR